MTVKPFVRQIIYIITEQDKEENAEEMDLEFCGNGGGENRESESEIKIGSGVREEGKNHIAI